MKSPEVDYFERIRNREGWFPVEFEFVLQLKDGVSFGELIEAMPVVYHFTEIGLHVTNDYWNDDDKYKTGILHAALFYKLEEYFRRKGFLGADENLRPVCYYSANVGRQNFIFLPPASPNLIIEASGGKFESDGPVICCIIPDSADFLETNGVDEHPELLRGIAEK